MRHHLQKAARHKIVVRFLWSLADLIADGGKQVRAELFCLALITHLFLLRFFLFRRRVPRFTGMNGTGFLTTDIYRWLVGLLRYANLSKCAGIPSDYPVFTAIQCFRILPGSADPKMLGHAYNFRASIGQMRGLDLYKGISFLLEAFRIKAGGLCCNVGEQQRHATPLWALVAWAFAGNRFIQRKRSLLKVEMTMRRNPGTQGIKTDADGLVRARNYHLGALEIAETHVQRSFLLRRRES